MAAVELLQQFDVPFNTLTCVHRFNRTHTARRLPLPSPRGWLDVSAVHSDRAGARLRVDCARRARRFRLPDAWRAARAAGPSRIGWRPSGRSIRTSTAGSCARSGDEVAAQRLRPRCSSISPRHWSRSISACRRSCACTASCAGKGVAVEHDGTVYACDHYVYRIRPRPPRRRALAGRSWCFSPSRFASRPCEVETLPQFCRQCSFLTDCWGECPKNRLLRAPDGEPGLNYLCAGLRHFFAHAGPQADETRLSCAHPPRGRCHECKEDAMTIDSTLAERCVAPVAASVLLSLAPPLLAQRSHPGTKVRRRRRSCAS